MGDAAVRKFGSSLVLAGMLCLFIAMALAVVGMFLLMRLDNPSGDNFLIIAKVFAGLWLPLIGIGILVRITNPESSPSGDTGANDSSSST